MSQRTDAELKTYLDDNINTNHQRAITGAKHNYWGTDIIDSKVNNIYWGANGFTDRDTSTISFDDATRTLTISPTGTDFEYFIGGRRVTSTGATVTIPDVTGMYMAYFDTDDTLKADTTTTVHELILNKALVAAIYWNSTQGKAIYFGEERHGRIMSAAAHLYLHTVNGCVYLSGLGVSDLSVDGSGASDSDAQFSVDSGDVADEDIHVTSPQKLVSEGLPIFYMEGSGEWKSETNTGFSVLTYDRTPNTRLAWNEWTGSAWQVSEVTNGDFVLCHIFATTDTLSGTVAIMGQNEYASAKDAREGANTEIHSLVLDEILFPEVRPVATIIFQTRDNYTNSVQARVVSTDTGAPYVDWRSEDVSRVEISTSDHGALTGLGDDDHTQYVLADGTRAFTGDAQVASGLSLKLWGPDNTFYSGFQSVAVASNQIWKLPTADGNADGIMVTDGSLGLSFKGIGDLLPFVSKGDILIFDGTDLVILGVGTDEQVLTADSTQAGGIKWADASGGGSSLWTEDTTNGWLTPVTSTYGINLAETTNASQGGVIYNNGETFIFAFSYGLNSSNITPYGKNTFIGLGTGNFTVGETANNPSEGSYNTGIGYNVVPLLGSGYNNTFIGSNIATTTSYEDGAGSVLIGNNIFNPTSNTSKASYSVIIGSDIPMSDATNPSGIYIGHSIGDSLVYGNNNVVLGNYLFRAATTASQNIIIGYFTADTSYDANYSIFMGYYSANKATSLASYSIGIGHYTLQNAANSMNVAIGYSSGSSGIDIKGNTFVGDRSGSKITDGDYNVGIGESAFGYGTMSNINNSVAIGQNALGDLNDNLAGNIGIGTSAGYRTYGNRNVIVGDKAAGYGSAHLLHNNVVIGGYAGYKIGQTSYSVVIGYMAGYYVSGGNNIFVGYQSGFNLTTGADNIFVGYYAGKYDSSGASMVTNSLSIMMGKNAKANAEGDTNEIAIGANVVGNGSNTATIGDSNVTDNYFNGKMHITSSIQVADDTDTATADNVGAIRYKADSNNSYVEMCMQTGASTYAWVVIKTNTW